MRQFMRRAMERPVFFSFVIIICLGTEAVVRAEDDSRGSLPQQGYTPGGPPQAGEEGGYGTGGPGNADPMQMPNTDAAMAEMRKVDPVLADKMEKLMQDAKAIGEEAAKRAKERAGQKQDQ